MLQWLWLLPLLNLPFIQASDISNSRPKSENVHNACLDCLDLIFFTFKTPESRSHAYLWLQSHQNIWNTQHLQGTKLAKHPHSGCFGISWELVTGPALSKGWRSRGFLHRSLFKTWLKPKTTYEKPMAPRVRFSTDHSTASSQMLGQSLSDMSYFCQC